jgi:hypothetical protein
MASNKQQTAVEFLQEALSIHFTFDDKMKFEGLFYQAKEMEKQYIIKANRDGVDMCLEHKKFLIGIDYFNENFNQ